MKPDCLICKHENTELCKNCFLSSYWGKCYFELDEEKRNNQKNDVFWAKDKLWDFVDIHTTGKPVVIRSKRQWQEHLKKLGMHDDCKQTNLRPEDLKTGESPYEKKKKKEEYKKILADAYMEKNRINLKGIKI